jgi:hypothetical protein
MHGLSVPVSHLRRGPNGCSVLGQTGGQARVRRLIPVTTRMPYRSPIRRRSSSVDAVLIEWE